MECFKLLQEIIFFEDAQKSILLLERSMLFPGKLQIWIEMKLIKWTHWILTKIDIIVNMSRNSKFYFTLKKASQRKLCQKLKWIDKIHFWEFYDLPKTASSKETLTQKMKAFYMYDHLYFLMKLAFPPKWFIFKSRGRP